MEEEVQLALPRRSSVGPGQAGLASPTCDQGLGQNIVRDRHALSFSCRSDRSGVAVELDPAMTRLHPSGRGRWLLGSEAEWSGERAFFAFRRSSPATFVCAMIRSGAWVQRAHAGVGPRDRAWGRVGEGRSWAREDVDRSVTQRLR